MTPLGFVGQAISTLARYSLVTFCSGFAWCVSSQILSFSYLSAIFKLFISLAAILQQILMLSIVNNEVSPD